MPSYLQHAGLLASLALVCPLSGCFWEQAALPAEPAAPPPPVLQFMIANAPGASAVLDDPQFGDGIRVTLEDSFMSAAGEICKRATVLSASQEAEIVVACREAERGWILAPRIWGQGIVPRS